MTITKLKIVNCIRHQLNMRKRSLETAESSKDQTTRDMNNGFAVGYYCAATNMCEDLLKLSRKEAAHVCGENWNEPGCGLTDTGKPATKVTVV